MESENKIREKCEQVKEISGIRNEPRKKNDTWNEVYKGKRLATSNFAEELAATPLCYDITDVNNKRNDGKKLSLPQIDRSVFPTYPNYSRRREYWTFPTTKISDLSHETRREKCTRISTLTTKRHHQTGRSPRFPSSMFSRERHHQTGRSPRFPSSMFSHERHHQTGRSPRFPSSMFSHGSFSVNMESKDKSRTDEEKMKLLRKKNISVLPTHRSHPERRDLIFPPTNISGPSPGSPLPPLSMNSSGEIKEKWTSPPSYITDDICVELDPFLRSGTAKNATKLIRSGLLPNQCTLDEMCLLFGRKSKVVLVTCRAICDYIKSRHDAILYVWAAYTLRNPQKITFVVYFKDLPGEEQKKKNANLLRLEKLIDYSFYKQRYGDFNPESTEIMKIEKPISSIARENDYYCLQSCLSTHSRDLMKKHRYLSIISASSHRSKGFGSSWTLVPENCIVLYVHTKDYIPIDEEPFETTYGGVPVDVREGAFNPFVLTAKDMLDPVKMGCQIQGEITGAGTIGCFIEHPQFGSCGVTCAHVLLSPWELIALKGMHKGNLKWPLQNMYKKVYQPEKENGSIGHTVQLILKEGSSEISGMDLALFKITSRHPKSASFPDSTGACAVNGINYEHWRICSANKLNPKENRVIKFGSDTELTEGIIVFDIVSVKELDSYPLSSGYAVIKLFKQIEVKPQTPGTTFANFGDSGALVFLVEENTKHTCIGIVEGGTSYGTVVVTPIVPVLEELNVSCLKNFETETQFSNVNEHISNLDRNVQSLGLNVQGIRGELQIVSHEIQNMKTTVANEFDAIKQIIQSLRT